MSKKTFIMLAAPSMIGKTNAANKLATTNPLLLVVHNDSIVQSLCDLTRFPVPDISKEEVWLPLIDAKVDFNALTGYLHREVFLDNAESSVVLAEGYMYMLQSYRAAVLKGLDKLNHLIDYHLVKYEPSLEEQIFRQKDAFKKRGWEETDEEHQRQLKVKWQKFEIPQNAEIQFSVANDTKLQELVSEILETQH